MLHRLLSSRLSSITFANCGQTVQALSGNDATMCAYMIRKVCHDREHTEELMVWGQHWLAIAS